MPVDLEPSTSKSGTSATKRSIGSITGDNDDDKKAKRLKTSKPHGESPIPQSLAEHTYKVKAGAGDIVQASTRKTSLTKDTLVSKIKEKSSEARNIFIPRAGTSGSQSVRSTPNLPAHSGDDDIQSDGSTSNHPDHSRGDRLKHLEKIVAKMTTPTSPPLTDTEDMQSVRSTSNPPALSLDDRITKLEKKVEEIGTAFGAQIQALTTSFEAQMQAAIKAFDDIHNANELMAESLMGVSNKIMFLKRTSNNLRLLVTASGRRYQNKEGLGQSKVLLHGVLRNCPLVH